MKVTEVKVSALKPHPRNYQKHPEEQLAHIEASIREHGFYRNVVVARDNTILAGHGVTEAAIRMGLETIPVIRLDIDPNSPAAIKVMVSDNEINNLAEVNDRELTELLRTLVNDNEIDLLGTGFNEEQLAALVLVTRHSSEILSKAQAEEWIGMPEYDNFEMPYKMFMSFQTAEDRQEFLNKLGYVGVSEERRSLWYPNREHEDLKSVLVTDQAV